MTEPVRYQVIHLEDFCVLAWNCGLNSPPIEAQEKILYLDGGSLPTVTKEPK